MTEPDERFNDTLCIKCGYNLHGLTPEANCPECGLAVILSLERGHLRLSDPAYLAKLHSALVFILFGTLLVLGFGILDLAIKFNFPIIRALAMLPLLAGSWLLATPDPSGAENPTAAVLRVMIRGYVVVAVLECASSLAPIGFYLSLGFTERLWLVRLFNLSACIGWLAILLYMRTIAQRLPNPKLSRFANQLACLMAIIIVALTLYYAVHNGTTALRSMRRFAPSETLPVVAWSRMAIYALSLQLLRSLSRRVQQQIELDEHVPESASPENRTT